MSSIVTRFGYMRKGSPIEESRQHHMLTGEDILVHAGICQANGHPKLRRQLHTLLIKGCIRSAICEALDLQKAGGHVDLKDDRHEEKGKSICKLRGGR